MIATILNMTQNQCVPNWDSMTIQPPPPPPFNTSPLPSLSYLASLSASHDTSTQDYEMAELTWENGHLAMHGLGFPRVLSKNNLGGTLESIVNQATHKLPLPILPICKYDEDFVPFVKPNSIQRTMAPTTIPIHMVPGMDALVPTTSARGMSFSKTGMGCSTRVGSCSAAGAGVPGYSDWSVSASGSDKWQGAKRGPEDTCEQLRSMTNNELTSTSFGASLDNTTKTVTFDDRDHDSVCHSRPQRERVEEEDTQKKTTSSIKRSRAAAVHNQSERKRRDKINERMKTLQKLVPNSNKADKASMLDEVIDYMKQLQSQLQMLNTMRIPSMMMPLALQQQLQMSMMAPMGMPPMGMPGMGMGMPGLGMNMNMNMNMDQMNMGMNAAMARPNIPGMPPSMLNPAAFMSLTAPPDTGVAQPTTMVQTDPLSMYLASQSHSITTDAYSRMATMYQQLQQQPHQSFNHGNDNNK